MHLDRKIAIAMASSYKYAQHTWNNMRHYHYVRDAIQSNCFKMQWNKTIFQMAAIGN